MFRGEQSFTKSQIKEIKKLYLAGEGYPRIAKKYKHPQHLKNLVDNLSPKAVVISKQVHAQLLTTSNHRSA